MKLSINQFTINLQACTSKDETRQVLTWVWYDSKGKRFVATDGHIANIIPYTAPMDDSDNFQYPDKDVYIRFPRVTLKDDRAILDTETGILTQVTAKKTSPVVCEIGKNEDIGEYPQIDKVLPTAERVFRIGIDAKCLFELAKSIQADGKLELAFSTSGISAIEVSNLFTEERKGRALIMPLRICDCKHGMNFIDSGISKDYVERLKNKAIEDYILSNAEPKPVTAQV